MRLARLLHDLMPDEPEVTGLLALALATHARRDARVDEQGELVLLPAQDRSRWHGQEIAEADRLLSHAVGLHRPGPYQVQAAIACLHCLAATAAETDWPQNVALYELLERMTPSPVVRVNRAIAVAEAESPQAGLAILADTRGPLTERWHLYWSAVAELSWRAGDTAAARAAFDSALDCSPNDSDRQFLLRRRGELADNGR